MQVATKSLMALVLVAVLTPTAQAVVTVYTTEAAFIAAAQGLGGGLNQEGFESDAWGAVRPISPTNPALSVLSQDVTWTSNFAAGRVSTSGPAANSGSWGFLASPHGSYATGGATCAQPGVCGDGFIGSTIGGFYAIGGWIRTNTPPARIQLSLDGSPVSFSSASLSTSFAYFGAISDTPFGRFEFREMNGKADDPKYIFADDFSFVRAAPVPEPSAYELMLLGLGLVGVAARRRIVANKP